MTLLVRSGEADCALGRVEGEELPIHDCGSLRKMATRSEQTSSSWTR